MQLTPITLYCDDNVLRDCFIPAVEKFVKNCEYTPSDFRDNSLDGDVISMRGNDGDEIPRVTEDQLNPTDCEYERRGNSQGAIYALTQFPHIRVVDEMARDELLHSSTVDLWRGDAFRKSRVDIVDRYLASPLCNLENASLTDSFMV